MFNADTDLTTGGAQILMARDEIFRTPWCVLAPLVPLMREFFAPPPLAPHMMRISLVL